MGKLINYLVEQDKHEMFSYVVQHEDKRVVINIFFKNDKFDRCIYDLDSPYSYEDWKLLGMIQEEIVRLQNMIAKGSQDE